MAYPPNSTLPPAHLPLVFQELGPACGEIVSIVREGDDSWVVRLDEDRIVYLSWRDEPARLELVTPFARLADSADVHSLRVLLMFNFLSADTNGCRMALSGMDETLVLMQDLPESSFSVQAVQAALVNLADLGRTWKVVLDDLHESPDGVHADSPELHSPESIHNSLHVDP